ncbi:MAG: hypothetical protein ACK4R9_07860 [Ignavibacterium sp.]
MRTKLVLIILLIISSCTEKTDYKNSDIFKPTQIYYCFISRVVEKNPDYFLDVDFVEVLTGDSAVEAAKKSGQAEFEITESGDTNWFVPNDYFILNTRIDSSFIQLDKDCLITIYVSDETTNYRLTEKRVSSIKTFQNLVGKDKIFEINISEGKIKAIKEFWIP